VGEKWTYSVDEYADMLGFTSQTAIAWMKKGLIPGEKVNGRWVIRKPEVDEWFRRQRVLDEAEVA
jgi:excisionase family DNA binding protein